MIKKILLLIAFLSFFLLCILNFELIKTIVENIFYNLIDYKKNDYFLFLILLIITNIFLFLTPMPTTPFIVFNGFLLGDIGFFLSYSIIIICSLIIFKLSKKLIYFLKEFSIYKNFFIKINNNKNNDFNFFVVASSRYVIPYFLHNIFFGSILKKSNIFLSAIILAEIPVIFVLNKFGKYLTNINKFESFDIKNILELELIFLLIILFFLIFIISRSSKYIKSKIS